MKSYAPFLLAAAILPLTVGTGAADCGPQKPATLRDAAVEIVLRTPAGPAFGTGIIWNTRGHIVTNDHVASSGDQPMVTLANGERRAARVLARAPDQDLAVLAVDGPLPAPAPRKIASGLRPGESVLAVGNPFGRGMSVAGGVVNGFGREVITGPGRRLTGMIETTAPLNPGNSGGPLVTCRGEVVGINTAAVQQGPAGSPLGFAITTEQADAVVNRLLQPDIAMAELTPAAPPRASMETSKRPGLGLYVVSGQQSLVIREVVPGSPAARAGALPGDAIIEANGRFVSSPADLQSLVQEAGQGSIAVLRIVRAGTALDMAVRISPIQFSS